MLEMCVRFFFMKRDMLKNTLTRRINEDLVVCRLIA